MTGSQLLAIAVSLVIPIISGITLWWVNRLGQKADKAETRMTALEREMAALKLSIASDLPDKEDFTETNRRIESVANTLSEVRDMVIRLVANEDARKNVEARR